MANPTLRVVLQAVDDVSGPSKKAAGGIEGFTSSVAGWFKGLTALLGGIGLGAFFNQAVQEGIAAQRSIDALRVAVNNAGGDFAAFGPVADALIDRLQRTTKATDDELRIALARLITTSKDVNGSLALLPTVLDVATAYTKSYDETATAFGKTMNGNTRAMREFGIDVKNTADPLGELKARTEGAAEAQAKGFGGALDQVRKQLGEVVEAVGLAIIGSKDLETGTFTLAAQLADLAKWIEQNDEVFSGFAGKMVASAKGILTFFSGVAGGWEILQGIILTAVGAIVDAVAMVMTPIGALLKLVGKDAMANWVAEAKRAAQNMKGEADRMMFEQKRDILNFNRDTVKAYYDANRYILQDKIKTGDEMTAAAKQAAQNELDAAEEYEIKRVMLANDAAKLIMEADSKINDNLKKQGLTWEQLHKKAEHQSRLLDDQLLFVAPLTASIEKNRDVLDEINAQEEERKQTLEKQLGPVQNIAQGLVDAAQSMGALNRDAASALTSMINMGVSLARVSGGDMTGLVGLIGSLANMIAGWGSSAEEKYRRQALTTATHAIDRLRETFGEFALGSTGRTFAGAKDVFGGAAAAAQDLLRPENFSGGFLGGKKQLSAHARDQAKRLRQTILRDLMAKGVNRSELEALLKELGVEDFLTTSDPELILRSIPKIIEALGEAQPGLYADTYEGQLEATEQAIKVHEIETPEGKLKEYAKLASFSPAIAAALRSKNPKAALRALFDKARTPPGLTDEERGDLNASQVVQLIGILLPLLPAMDLPEDVRTSIDAALGGAAARSWLPDFTGDTSQGIGTSGLDERAVGGGGTQNFNSIVIESIVVQSPPMTGDATYDAEKFADALYAALDERFAETVYQKMLFLGKV